MSRFHCYFIGKFPKYRWYEKLWIQLKNKCNKHPLNTWLKRK